MVWAHPIMAIAAGLTMGLLVAFAAVIAPRREVTSPLIEAFWRVGLPALMGFETWNAADRNRWVTVTFLLVAAGAVIAVAAWERRRRA